MNLLLPTPWLVALAVAVVVSAVVLVRNVRHELLDDEETVKPGAAKRSPELVFAGVEAGEEGLPIPVLLGAVSAYVTDDLANKKITVKGADE